MNDESMRNELSTIQTQINQTTNEVRILLQSIVRRAKEEKKKPVS